MFTLLRALPLWLCSVSGGLEEVLPPLGGLSSWLKVHVRQERLPSYGACKPADLGAQKTTYCRILMFTWSFDVVVWGPEIATVYSNKTLAAFSAMPFFKILAYDPLQRPDVSCRHCLEDAFRHAQLLNVESLPQHRDIHFNNSRCLAPQNRLLNAILILYRKKRRVLNW